MGLTITHSNLLTRRYLKIRKDGVKFYGGSFFGGRRFRFEEIDCVLLSATHELSFQVGQEVFTIATRPDKPKHQQTVAALLEGLERSRSQKGASWKYHFAP